MSKYTFDAVSTITMRRSRFDIGHRVKTSMKVGYLYPVDCVEVLPGDNIACDERHLVRLSSAYLCPVMDNVFMDTYSFFVPLRLVYDKYEGVFGKISPNGYVTRDFEQLPHTTKSFAVYSKTVADYLGLPVNDMSANDPDEYNIPAGINVCKFRAFALIYDEWFRNQNVVDPMLVQKGDWSESAESLNNNDWSPTNYMGKPPKVSKKKDYFTSCLPAPQKGPPVDIGTSIVPAMSLPVHAKDEDVLLSQSPARYLSVYGGEIDPTTVLGLYGDPRGNKDAGFLQAVNGVNNDGTDSSKSFAPLNFWSEFPQTAVQSANVNDLRFAFQLQKMLEKDARGGGRYREYLLAHWGVQNADSRMQVPEFLGGKRTPLSLQQVAQTSQGTSDSPLASLAAYSQTMGKSGYRKAFTEHGYIITVACIRYEHSYQQGIDRSWMRTKREDIYDPLFANLGEQPVYRSQLYGYSRENETLTEHAFGYQEAWADYRYMPDYVTGEMRSVASNSFDIYHFADNYGNAPVLGKQFIEENGEFFRRTTAVGKDADVDDFLVDFYFDAYAYRTMPVRSIPGLIDHH